MPSGVRGGRSSKDSWVRRGRAAGSESCFRRVPLQRQPRGLGSGEEPRGRRGGRFEWPSGLPRSYDLVALVRCGLVGSRWGRLVTSRLGCLGLRLFPRPSLAPHRPPATRTRGGNPADSTLRSSSQAHATPTREKNGPSSVKDPVVKCDERGGGVESFSLNVI